MENIIFFLNKPAKPSQTELLPGGLTIYTVTVHNPGTRTQALGGAWVGVRRLISHLQLCANVCFFWREGSQISLLNPKGLRTIVMKGGAVGQPKEVRSFQPGEMKVDREGSKVVKSPRKSQ